MAENLGTLKMLDEITAAEEQGVKTVDSAYAAARQAEAEAEAQAAQLLQAAREQATAQRKQQLAQAQEEAKVLSATFVEKAQAEQRAVARKAEQNLAEAVDYICRKVVE